MPFGAYDPFFAPILGPASLYGCYDSYGWAHPDYWRYCGGMSPYFLSYGPGFYNGYYGLYGNGWIVTSPPVDGGGGVTGRGPVGGPRRERPRLHADHAGGQRRPGAATAGSRTG